MAVSTRYFVSQGWALCEESRGVPLVLQPVGGKPSRFHDTRDALLDTMAAAGLALPSAMTGRERLSEMAGWR